MKRNENPDALLARWYAGETTDAEENRLREHFATDDRPKCAPSANDDSEIDAMLFAGFRELGTERMPGTSLRPSCPPADSYRSAIRTNRRPFRHVVWKSAAIAAVITLGIVLGLQLRTPYCYINGEAVYDKETALAATDCLKGLSVLELPERMLEQLLEN